MWSVCAEVNPAAFSAYLVHTHVVVFVNIPVSFHTCQFISAHAGAFKNVFNALIRGVADKQCICAHCKTATHLGIRSPATSAPTISAYICT